MKKLHLIKNFLLIAEFLMVAGLALAIYFVGSMENGTFSPIGEPNLEITSREVSDSMYSLIPRPDSEEPIILHAKYVDFSLKVTPQLKAIIVGMAVLVVYTGVNRVDCRIQDFALSCKSDLATL